MSGEKKWRVIDFSNMIVGHDDIPSADSGAIGYCAEDSKSPKTRYTKRIAMTFVSFGVDMPNRS